MAGNHLHVLLVFRPPRVMRVHQIHQAHMRARCFRREDLEGLAVVTPPTQQSWEDILRTQGSTLVWP